MLEEDDIHKMKDLFSEKTIKFLTLFIGRLTKKYTFCGSGIQFSSMLGMDMDKHRTTEDFEWKLGYKMKCRESFMKRLAWSFEVQNPGGHSVDEVSGCEDCFTPESFGNMRGEQ